MKSFQTINPYTLQVIQEHTPDSLSILNQKIQAAEQAFRYWQSVKPWEKSEILTKTATLLRQNKVILAALITEEMGKPVTESAAEVEKCAATCEYYSKNLLTMLEVKDVISEFQKSYIIHQPLGIILGIMPWNFPLWQVIRFAVPTLAAGNTVLIKHAPNVLGCSKNLESILLDAGFPEGVFQNIIIDTDAVKDILADNRVKGVSLTGSERAGKAVAAHAGSQLKKSVLELGSNDPFIVLRDADLDKAAAIALQSRMQNAGQVCISAKRIIVEEPVKEEFVQKVLQRISDWTPGDPMLHTTKMGPLARPDLADNLEAQYREAIGSGAIALTEFKRQNCLIDPVILDNVSHSSVAFREETFGPLMAIISAKTEEYAIALANDSRFGLGATVFTEDRNRGEKIAHRLQAGVVFVNELVKSDPRFPVGGINNSGYGRELSHYGMLEFTNIKTIILN